MGTGDLLAAGRGENQAAVAGGRAPPGRRTVFRGGQGAGQRPEHSGHPARSEGRRPARPAAPQPGRGPATKGGRGTATGGSGTPAPVPGAPRGSSVPPGPARPPVPERV